MIHYFFWCFYFGIYCFFTTYYTNKKQKQSANIFHKKGLFFKFIFKILKSL
ncbi:hypothetical protein FNB79_03890 [Formosa sediminum]|uniref:CDR ABC transporter domain-containing protein n=1 Tax=Formosa sediminum TaxID=2594004 RepID=A0A516GVX1_9FLAO|nr:hypothetical protein FNB79_03890 [Formosa sediminum]